MKFRLNKIIANLMLIIIIATLIFSTGSRVVPQENTVNLQHLAPISLNNTSELEMLMSIHVNDDRLNSLALSTNEYDFTLIAGEQNPTLHIWQSSIDGIQVFEVSDFLLGTHVLRDGSVSKIIFMPDGRSIAILLSKTIGDNDMILVWDLIDKEQITYYSSPNRIWDFDVSPQGDYMVLGLQDATTCILNLVDDELQLQSCFQYKEAGTSSTSAVAYNSTGELIVSGNAKWGVQIIVADDYEVLQSYSGFIQQVAFSPDDLYLSYRTLAGGLYLVNITTMQRSALVNDESHTNVYGLEFNNDSSLLITRETEISAVNTVDSISFWDVKCQQCEQPDERLFIEEGIRLFTLSPDQKLLAIINNFGEITIWGVVSE